LLKERHRILARLNLSISVLCILALVGIGYAAETAALPAKQWNLENLKKIKGLPAGPLSFAVFGDNRDNPTVFGRVLKKVDWDSSVTFAIHLGDMVKKADLEQYQIFFKEVRLNLHKPLLTVIGNHELYGERGPELYHRIFGPDYYSFQIQQNYFIMVNDGAKEGMNQEQLRWLEEELQKSQTYKTRLVFLHIPLYDPRSGENKPHSLQPEEAAKLLPLFKKYNVSHVFAAHIHDYYTGEWEGLPYTITGGAGAPLYGDDPKHAFYHYLKVTLSGQQVQIQVRPLPGDASQIKEVRQKAGF
jgi:3',5'-cyclic AMP phosphodiesterase CpdA